MTLAASLPSASEAANNHRRRWRFVARPILAIAIIGCGRTGLWIPATTEPIHPPPCSSTTRQITISLRPDPGARPTGQIRRVVWEVNVACLSAAGSPASYFFQVEQEPQGAFVVSPASGPVGGNIVSHVEQLDSVAFTFAGEVQANWCVRVTVHMTGGPDVTSPYVFASEHPDPPGIALLDLPFLLAQNTNGSLAVNPAFRHSNGCLAR